MNEHHRIQNRLYEYLKNELPEPDQKIIEAHLASCETCRIEADSIASVIRSLDETNTDWSALQPPGYWNVFSHRVEEAITQEEKKRRPWFQSFGEWLDAVAAIRPRDVAIAGAVCTLLLVAGLNVKRMMLKEPLAPPPQQIAKQEEQSVREMKEIQQYFRRSKALLVGLANMKMEEAGSTDFASEREASRELLNDSRRLRQQPLDSRSERLMNDMEKIFLKVANTGDNHEISDLELIRDGIERQNLLYKVRRAQTTYKAVPVNYASNNE